MFLKEVELIDFMCHEHLIFQPRRLTLIFGRNGSGKSAILEAINLAFGGLGRERQDLLRGFIRHGKSRAIIRLKVSNAVYLPGSDRMVVLDPMLPPKADIVIERIIKPDGSIYRLNGRRVTREKIVLMLSKANISAKNPFFFVPQERITRLVDMRPEDRLDAILAGLGLLELKNAIMKLKEEIKQYELKRKELEEKIRDVESRMAEHKKMLSSLDTVVSTLKNYYIYKLALLYEKRSTYIEREEKTQQVLLELENKQREYRRFLDEFPEKIAEIDNKIKNLYVQRAEIIAESREFERNMETLKSKEDELLKKLRQLNEREAETTKNIREILRKWKVASLEDLESLLSSKKDELVDLEKMIESTEQTRRIRELERQLIQMKKELEDLQKARNEYLKGFEEIFALLDPSGNVKRVYDFIIRENLVEEVQGPLLLEITFKTSHDTLKQYAIAFEKAMDRDLMGSFVVLTPRALRRIMNFVKKLEGEIPKIFFFGHEKSPWIIEDQFSYFRHIVSQGVMEAYDGYKKNLNDMLDRLPSHERSGFICLIPDIINAPRATKTIITFFLGKTAIVSKLETGLSLMRSLNLERIVTIEGEVVQKYWVGDGAIYYMLPAPKKLMENPEKTLIWMAKNFNVRKFREKQREILDAMESLKENIDRLKGEIDRMVKKLPQDLRRLWAQKAKIKETIVKLTSDIAYLRKAYRERDRLPEQIKKIQQQLEEIDREIARIESQRSETTKRIAEIDNEVVALEKEKENMVSMKGVIMAELDRVEDEILSQKATLEAIRGHRLKLESEIDSIKRDIRALIVIIWSSMYNKKSQNINVDTILEKEIIEPAAEIVEKMDEKEIEQILSRYDDQKILNLRYEIMERQERIKALEEAQKELDKYKRELDLIVRETESARILAEKTLRRLLDDLREKVDRLAKNYRYVLSKIGANGDVRLVGDSLDRLSLEISIDLHREKPVELLRGSFSSGEKTLAIFAFIIALYLTSPAPILLLDEFDVYLDDPMARRAAKILRGVLGDLKHIQCILTTTHRVELMRVSDHIINLVYDPRKQHSLAFEVRKKDIEKIVRRGRSPIIL